MFSEVPQKDGKLSYLKNKLKYDETMKKEGFLRLTLPAL